MSKKLHGQEGGGALIIRDRNGDDISKAGEAGFVAVIVALGNVISGTFSVII